MTFTTSLKEEISKNESSLIETRFELESFIRACAKIENEIVITLENASVARKIYKDIKVLFNINPVITVRIQKRFRVKQIYILTIKDNIDFIKKVMDLDNDKVKLPTAEEKTAFLQGAFLAIGNISNPQKSGYHLEYICSSNEFAIIIESLLSYFDFSAKIVKRGYKYIVYIKRSENKAI